MALLNILENDCRQWAGQDVKTLLLNERDMQVRLTMYLEKTQHYDKVYTEYLVPLEMLRNLNFEVPTSLGDKKWTTPDNFPWHEDMSIDIVVEKAGKFAAVELKYATTQIVNALTVFNQPTPPGVEVVSDKAAVNQILHDYWKDVRRIEALTRFRDVEGGVAMLICNDRIYWNRPNNPGYMEFSSYEGHKVGSGRLEWGDSCPRMKRDNPVFKLDKSYTCAWADTSIKDRAKKGDEPFRYMLNVIK